MQLGTRRMEKIILIGGGGHCHACIDVIKLQGFFEVAGIIESSEINSKSSVLEYPVIGTDNDLKKYISQYKNVLITIGQIKRSSRRLTLFNLCKELGGIFPVIISPRAYISPNATIQEGTIVMHSATVNMGAAIGSNCIINSHALIEHDVSVGNHTHISTGAIINGNSQIGDECFVGSGSLVRNGIKVENNCLIGMGQTVLQDMPFNTNWIKKIQ